MVLLLSSSAIDGIFGTLANIVDPLLLAGGMGGSGSWVLTEGSLSGVVDPDEDASRSAGVATISIWDSRSKGRLDESSSESGGFVEVMDMGGPGNSAFLGGAGGAD